MQCHTRVLYQYSLLCSYKRMILAAYSRMIIPCTSHVQVIQPLLLFLQLHADIVHQESVVHSSVESLHDVGVVAALLQYY
jgi:hypothetical protein